MSSPIFTAHDLSRRMAPHLSRLARRLSASTLLWVCTGLFLVAVLTVTGYSRSRSDRWLQEQVAAVATLAADRVAGHLDAVDALLLSLVEDLQAMDQDGFVLQSAESRPVVRALLERHQGLVPGLISLGLADTAGHRPFGAPATATGDRVGHPDFHRALAQGARQQPMIWMRDQGADGWPVLQVARRVSGSDGRLLGALVAEIDLRAALWGFHDTLNLANGDFLALRGRGNELLAGHPASPGVHSAALDIVPAAVAKGLADGVRRDQSATDGRPRLVAYHKLARYPFYLVYGRGDDPVNGYQRGELIGALIAGLMALAVSTAATVGIRRHALVTAQLQMVRRHLKDSNRALRTALADMELLAAKDQLTGLCNRRSFDQRLREAVSHRQRHGGNFALLMLDLDHFKSINDRHGHLVGDDVLRRVANALRDRLRQNDAAARWGGEEFAVLADGAELGSAIRLAEQIRLAVSEAAFPEVGMVSVSIGVAEHAAGESEDQLLQRADRALYEAKRGGRNQVVAANGPGK